jgi:RNA polymerase sigma-70 factor (ECF subfamily)
MSESEASDKEILSGFKTHLGREAAFKLLIKKYQRKTYWHIRRIVIDHDDADDVVQNTFIKIWENIDQFREDAKLYTWIFRIATNEALQFINRKKSNLHVSIEDLQFSLADSLQSSAYFNGDKAALKLQQAILTLPEKQRLVFNMKYFDNLKYEEIEEILGTSTGALKASYHHAVKKIEEFLKDG